MNRKILFCVIATTALGSLVGCSNKLSNGELETKDFASEEQKSLEEFGCFLVPNKYISNFMIGDIADYTATKISSINTDGAVTDVTKECSFLPTQGTIFDKAGEQTVEVTHIPTGLTCNYKINVENNFIVSITATAFKSQYVKGDQIDHTSTKITGYTYNGGTVDVSSKCQFNVEQGTVLNTSGNKEILARYNNSEITCTFTINVDEIASIEVSGQMDETLVYQDIDYSDISVTGITTNGNRIDIRSECTFSPAQGTYITNLGTLPITISHPSGANYSFNVDVVESYGYKIKWNGWGMNRWYEEKDISKTAKSKNELIFGRTYDYANEVKNLDPYAVGETKADLINMYVDNTNSKVFILADEPIIFEDNDVCYSYDNGYTNIFSWFKGTTLTINNVDLRRLTIGERLFCYSSNLETINLPRSLNTKKMTSMKQMFSVDSKLKTINNIEAIDTSNVTDFSYMFSQCPTLETIDLSSFDTSNVTKMDHLFWGNSLLKSANLSTWNTSKVEDMTDMFGSTTSLESVDLSSFDTSNVTSMEGMFACNYKLTSLDLSNFRTPKLTNMDFFIGHCTSLTSLNLSNFDTSKVTDMSNAFSNLEALKVLDLRNFTGDSLTDVSYMFSNCTSLESFILRSDFLKNNPNNQYAMYYNTTCPVTKV